MPKRIINGKQIKNLDDYITNIKLYEEIDNTRFITFKNNLNKKSILIVDNIVEEEKFLSEKYKYDINTFFAI